MVCNPTLTADTNLVDIFCKPLLIIIADRYVYILIKNDAQPWDLRYFPEIDDIGAMYSHKHFLRQTLFQFSHTQQSDYGLIHHIRVNAHILTHAFDITNIRHIDTDNPGFGLHKQRTVPFQQIRFRPSP